VLPSLPINDLRKKGYEVEVLIIDGGSIDGTVELVKKMGATVIVESTKGYGRAYKTGFQKSKGQIICTLDGDGSYPTWAIPNLVSLVENGYDFVTTDRLHFASKNSFSGINKIGNSALSIITSILFRINLHDSQSGMWCFKKSALDHLDLQHDGMPFSEEIKIKAFIRLDNCAEFSIPYYQRTGSPKLNRVRDGLFNLIYLIQLYLQIKMINR
jgi:glycosyltransferase involved in cell wall biosynthesis